MIQDEKKYLRGILFRHLDGIAISPTIAALENNGINKFILENLNFNFRDLTSSFKNNPGPHPKSTNLFFFF